MRTSHNEPSSAFIEAADRLGIYVLEEAFDGWGIGKTPGDYNLFFDTDWKNDLTAMVRRDRSHPCVIMWSTGAEVNERGGAGNGYALGAEMANTVRSLDKTRPVTNGVCSFWSGLDEELMTEQLMAVMATMQAGGTIQNADADISNRDHSWESLTEPFMNSLDVAGYNYMERRYESNHEIFPERIMVGTETFPKEIGIHWPFIEKTPYVIGDFTWTAFDYIGEAGIGRTAFFDDNDPALKMEAVVLSSGSAPFPWRMANDADYDNSGELTPQGMYRQIIWGSPATHVFAYDPACYGKQELISRWGFVTVERNWNWQGQEGRPTRVVVFSGADEVELFINGISQGILKAGERLAGNTPELPKSFLFDVVYEPGEVIAVSRTNGVEVSRVVMNTTGRPACVRLVAEKDIVPADGHSLIYVHAFVCDEEGNLVPDADNQLTASVEGSAELVGFGSANPVTAQNYKAGEFDAYHGKVLAVIRAGYEPGEARLTVKGDGIGEAGVTLTIGR